MFTFIKITNPPQSSGRLLIMQQCNYTSLFRCDNPYSLLIFHQIGTQANILVIYKNIVTANV